MTSEELQIGDWVLCDMYNPIDPYYPPGAFAPFQVRPEDFTNGIIEQYKPLPITPEILIQNGFIKQDFDGWEYMEPDDNSSSYLSYRILWRTDYDNHLFIEKYTGRNIGRVQILNIDYVHQLQHALKLFNIDKEITIK